MCCLRCLLILKPTINYRHVHHSTPTPMRKYLREISYLFLSLKFSRLITSIDEMQSNTTINICIAKRCLYTASLNNDMFRPLYRPSSVCTFSYFKVNYTIYSVFVNEVSCTSINSEFKNNYSSSGVKNLF